MLDFKLFLEKVYNINLAANKTDYSYIGKNKGRFNRLKHLIYQIEQSGSPLEGEKVSEILLGAVNLNTLNSSYPFVDIKVISPIKGVTKNNELISIKTSRDAHTLEDAVTYVNGFKISQLIQFAITKIGLKIFKGNIFKDRFAMKLSSITSYYEKTINNLFFDDVNVYTYAFINTINILNFVKDYFNHLRGDHIIEEDRKILYAIISVCIAFFIDKKFNTNYIDRIDIKLPRHKLDEIKLDVREFISIPNKRYDFKSDYSNFGDALPEEIKNLLVSYCIIYFNDESDEVIMNLEKTQSVTFSELFDKGMKIWIRKGYHISHILGDIKSKKMIGNKNYYLNYKEVIEAFSTNTINGPDVFSTHIKVKIAADWEYKEREESVKKLYVKVIDNIKGIENDASQIKILKLLNKFLRKITSADQKTKDNYIQRFSEIFPEKQNNFEEVNKTNSLIDIDRYRKKDLSDNSLINLNKYRK